MEPTQQQYCLRWNNHHSNLLNVFQELLESEAFTDVSLVCDGGNPIKCHRMVLAACSPYFQNLFKDLPCKRPVVVLKDIKYIEMYAILQYMYRGEVNVAQDHLAAMLKVAEALKVKGLVEENRSCKTPPPQNDSYAMNYNKSSSPISSSNHHHQPIHTNGMHNGRSISPPETPNLLYKTPYMFENKPTEYAHLGLPMWGSMQQQMTARTSKQRSPPLAPNPTNHHHAAAAAAMLTGAYDVGGSDLSPLKRKKLSSLLFQRDTPILRTVLGQGQADSSQSIAMGNCHSDNGDSMIGSNQSDHSSAGSSVTEDRKGKRPRNEPLEDAQSPYTDFVDQSISNDDEDKSKLAIPSSSPQSLGRDDRANSSAALANYVPPQQSSAQSQQPQKPEWKRYKLYTRDEIMAAIEAVRSGMSALSAARKYHVPSRTLYDKVKKLGIATSRPFKRGSNGSSSACFPFRRRAPSCSRIQENNNSALLEATTYIKHVLDTNRGSGEEREALAAMAVASMAQAVARETSPPISNIGHTRSPSPIQRTSPAALSYMGNTSLTPSPPAPAHVHNYEYTSGSSEREREDDTLDSVQCQVEDLSIHRKPREADADTTATMESRVIMPRIGHASATAIKKEHCD